MSTERIYAAISDAFYDARNSGRTMTQAAKAATAAVEAIVAAHTNAAVEQAHAEVNARWAAALEGHQLVERGRLYDTCSCGWYGSGYLNHLLTADHTAALDAVKAEAARTALLAAADEWTHGGWADTPRRSDRVADRMAASQYAGDWLRRRAERHGSES